jgi:hypothetical protein
MSPTISSKNVLSSCLRASSRSPRREEISRPENKSCRFRRMNLEYYIKCWTTYRQFLPRLENIQYIPYLFSICGPMLRRNNTVLNGVSTSEIVRFLVLRKRNQLEQEPRSKERRQPNIYTLVRRVSLFNRVNCISIFIETDPIFSTFRSLDVTIDSIANVTCPLEKQVGHLRVAPEGHDIVANCIDHVLDNLGSRISLG